MKHFGHRLLAAASIGMLALALGACDQSKTASTPGEKLDSAIAKTDQAAQQAKADASAAGAQAAQSLKEAGANAKAALADAGAAAGQAIDDAGITASVSAGLAKDPDLSAIHIDVDTKGGAVTLSGPAPSAAAKARAEEIAKGVTGVSSVTNKLEVKAM